MSLDSGRGQHTASVALLHIGVVLELVSVDVGQLASSSVQDGLRGTRVPLLTARTGEHVGMSTTLKNQQNLAKKKGTSHKQTFSHNADPYL